MRLHDLTRDKSFLRRGCAYIIISAILICWCIRLLFPKDSPENLIRELLAPHDGTQLLSEYQDLRQATQPDPQALLRWLRGALHLYLETNDPTEVIPSQGGATVQKVFGHDLPPLLQQHTRNAVELALFTDYTAAVFLPPTLRPPGHQRLEQHLATTPSPRFLREMMGDVQRLNQQPREALLSYLQEAAHPEARDARELAMRLAFQLEDDSALARLVDLPVSIADEVSHERLRQIAQQLNDHPLLVRAHWQLIRNNWSQPVQVSIAVMAAIIWSVILFCSGNRQKRTIWLCATGLLAGLASAWLVRWCLDAFNYGISAELQATSAMHNILHCILYIGIPEEAAKLLLLFPFIPWLLTSRHPDHSSNVALLGGFIGLGFALEENLQYFIEGNESVALGRLLTANVIHISLTGYIAWQFLRLLQSRFHLATDFLVAFAMIASAHGLYNFFIGGGQDPNWEGTDLFAYIILALCARQYFQKLGTDTPIGRRFTISRTCVFVFGATFLTGLIMIILTLRAVAFNNETIVPVLYSAIALIPVALIYIHEFHEVR